VFDVSVLAGLALAVGIWLYLLGSFLLMRGHTEPRPFVSTLRSMLRELFWVTLTQPALLLWYVVGTRMGHGRGGAPVVFVHGYMQNRIGFVGLARRLRGARVGTMYGFNYPWWSHVRSNAIRLARFIEHVSREENAARVDLVCHSMGGLVAFEAMRAEHEPGRVRRCVTIASPHAGVAWRGPMLGFGSADLRRDSAYLTALGALELRVPTLSIYSSHDNIVYPPATSALAHRGGEDALLEGGPAHFSILFSPTVAARVADFLEREDVPAATLELAANGTAVAMSTGMSAPNPPKPSPAPVPSRQKPEPLPEFGEEAEPKSSEFGTEKDAKDITAGGFDPIP
jgi:triacylglycerol esterase/lipase EstA (alpha/beta hydrolase family)